jgi:hypothetical protein
VGRYGTCVSKILLRCFRANDSEVIDSLYSLRENSDGNFVSRGCFLSLQYSP